MIKTELDAVNRMLSHVGEATVSSLTAATLNANADVAQALNTLRQATSEVQEQGVFINEECQTLSPDESGHIQIPYNCLNIRSNGRDATRHLAARGDKLYDLDNNTSTFSASVEVKVIIELSFSDLPLSVRNYIVMSAIVTFIIFIKGDDARLPYTESQIQQARAALDKSRASNARPNMLTDAPESIGRYSNNIWRN